MAHSEAATCDKTPHCRLAGEGLIWCVIPSQEHCHGSSDFISGLTKYRGRRRVRRTRESRWNTGFYNGNQRVQAARMAAGGITSTEPPKAAHGQHAGSPLRSWISIARPDHFDADGRRDKGRGWRQEPVAGYDGTGSCRKVHIGGQTCREAGELYDVALPI